ncbi:unnamed protein product [Spirodela intermedia]|uniref:Uncharacterized protein n=2 Tax=Spirodela intermedia TaxID=51605 RepID=A0A7I8KP99_SPIIN|nr:unnamed protein product [Spirodela intermedia]CAA6662889.1 unnamed protein product [Spirodela intermedia]CAA7399302.1 unnamed protein product [Spirodela intermedia]
MASLTMPTSFFGGAAGVSERSSPAASRRRLLVVKAVRPEAQGCAAAAEAEGARGRRAAILAVAAAAVSAVGAAQNAAMADDEPKKGTPEAKKKYAPICVTMPTASICRK